MVYDAQELRHPAGFGGRDGASFVPNNFVLGGAGQDAAPRFMLLTGPNMGGKSTCLRQACLAAILAQVRFPPASCQPLQLAERC